MSATEVSIFAAGVPAYLKDVELDATTKALAGSGGSSKRISIKGGVFRLISNGEQIAQNDDRAMNIIVVAAAPTVGRTYYEGTYVEGSNESPDCWSADGQIPDASSPKKQCDTCNKCPQNIAGSGQGDSRACRYSQRVAVVLENDPQGDVYQLSLAATSIFGKGENMQKLPLQAYARFLASNGTPITAVVTEMRFDTSVATPKLTFKAIRALTKDEYDNVLVQGASYDAMQAITMSVSRRATDKPKEQVSTPAAETPAKVTKAKTAKVAEPEVEVAEPTVVKGKAKPAVPEAEEASTIASVLAEWGDDDPED